MAETSVSLLQRLRQQPEETDWQRLVEMYSPLIRTWLRQQARGLREADDVVQDVLAVVVRRLAPDSRKIELNEKAATHVEGDTCRPWRSILRRSMLPARPAPQHCGAI